MMYMACNFQMNLTNVINTYMQNEKEFKMYVIHKVCAHHAYVLLPTIVVRNGISFYNL